MNQAANLSNKAFSTLIASSANLSVRVFFGLIFPPIALSILGSGQYGMWLALTQFVGIMALTDLRPMGALKLALSIRQHDADASNKRELMTSAVILSVITTPLLLLIAYWVSKNPALFFSSLEYSQESHSTLLWLLTFALLVDRFFSLASNVLRGTNQEYSGAKISLAITVFFALLSILVLKLGYGLPGLAILLILEKCISGLYLWIRARRHINWIGFKYPDLKTFTGFAKLSVLACVSSLSYLFLSSTDLYAVNYFFNTTETAHYAISTTLPRWSLLLIVTITGVTSAGVAGLCGAGDWHRVARVRSELIRISLLMVTPLAAIIIAFNRQFVTLWISEDYYVGDDVTIILALTLFFNCVMRIDLLIADSLTELGKKILIQLSSAGIAIMTVILLSSSLGIFGLSVGYFAGYVCLSLMSAMLIKKVSPLGSLIDPSPGKSMKMFSTIAILLLMSAAIARQQLIPSGFSLAALAILWGIFNGCVCLAMLFDKAERTELYIRVRKIRFA